LDPEKRRALSNFYREEFARHIQQLQTSGIVTNRAAMDHVCRRFMEDLDHVCCRSDFAAIAESLLQNFEALTRLSELAPRQGH
jgi:hypothetical protein